MELNELGGKITSVPSRSFYSPGFGQHFNRASSGAVMYSLSEGPGSLKSECFSPFVSFSRSATGANTQVAFGCHVTSSCYTCTVPPGSAFHPSGTSHSTSGNVGGHSAHKQNTVGLSKAAQRCDEVPGSIRDLGLYQNCTGPYPYSRIPGYIDVPVTQRVRSRDQRRESSLSLEGYKPWNWSSSWTEQVYCPKEQTQTSHIWKSSLTEDTALSQSDPLRIRKKRVPYTKLQLKELEHEYTITKFITKERRRRIASSTKLSERQVTIWFQNRRVKDKKIISKISQDFEPYQ